MDSGMYFGIQKSAIAALQSDAQWFADLNAVYAKRRLLVWKIMDALNCTYQKDTAGLFVWGKVPDNTNGEAVSDYLLYQKNVFVTPGFIFGSQGASYIRISLCETETLLKSVLNRLK